VGKIMETPKSLIKQEVELVNRTVLREPLQEVQEKQREDTE
jgi:hypothetical protein